VQQGNETSIKGGKSRDKNCTRSHLFASVYKDKLLNYSNKKFTVAPMMDWTDRHCRVFHRSLSRHALLYTEMVTGLAVKHGNREKLLGFDAVEQPVALQLGGSDPGVLAEAARIGEQWGYCEINLNVGCPSDRVQGGNFGACLMATPDLVAECVSAMQSAVKIPVTVKCRIGIDDQDSEQDFQHFIETVAGIGCKTFIVHARKAWLQGLSPKENREIPPLDYDRVHRLKKSMPHLNIILNGGLVGLSDDIGHLESLDGLMYGREAYHNPWMLTAIDPLVAGEPAPFATRRAAAEAMFGYITAQLNTGQSLHRVTRHMLRLFHAQPGGRAWRQVLSGEGCKPGAGLDVVREALDAVDTMAQKTAEAA
jgi:tRNA-dihydrouridine synthase A